MRCSGKRAYDNREHAAWENPFTHEKSADSFWDRYEKAQQRFDEVSSLFDADGFTAEAARAITHDLNFSVSPSGASCSRWSKGFWGYVPSRKIRAHNGPSAP